MQFSRWARICATPLFKGFVGVCRDGWRRKIIAKTGKRYVVLIDADRLDFYDRLEREHIHLLLMDDATRGLADVEAARIFAADAALAEIQRRRASTVTGETVEKRG